MSHTPSTRYAVATLLLLQGGAQHGRAAPRRTSGTSAPPPAGQHRQSDPPDDGWHPWLALAFPGVGEAEGFFWVLTLYVSSARVCTLGCSSLLLERLSPFLPAAQIGCRQEGRHLRLGFLYSPAGTTGSRVGYSLPGRPRDAFVRDFCPQSDLIATDPRVFLLVFFTLPLFKVRELFNAPDLPLEHTPRRAGSACPWATAPPGAQTSLGPHGTGRPPFCAPGQPPQWEGRREGTRAVLLSCCNSSENL